MIARRNVRITNSKLFSSPIVDEDRLTWKGHRERKAFCLSQKAGRVAI